MALPPPKCGEMGAFYRVLGLMELSAVPGYTTGGAGLAGIGWSPDGKAAYVVLTVAGQHQAVQLAGESLSVRRDQVDKYCPSRVSMYHPASRGSDVAGGA
jgi:sugar lactone lactonase YvrE